MPSGNLENVLWFESDRLLTLPDALTDAKLANQRDVVRNERRQGLENTPYGRWFKLVAENLFPSRHPYANDVIGMHEDLAAASIDDVRDFFRTYYTPNNLSLVIAGDFDPAVAKPLVEKYFGTDSCRAAARPAGAQHAPARWREDHRGAGPRFRRSGPTSRGTRRPSSSRGMPSSIWRRRFSPTACRRG